MQTLSITYCQSTGCMCMAMG